MGGFIVFSLHRSALIIRALARSQRPSDSSSTILVTILSQRWKMEDLHDLGNHYERCRLLYSVLADARGGPDSKTWAPPEEFPTGRRDIFFFAPHPMVVYRPVKIAKGCFKMLQNLWVLCDWVSPSGRPDKERSVESHVCRVHFDCERYRWWSGCTFALIRRMLPKSAAPEW